MQKFYVTNNYNLFKKLPGNRPVDSKHVNRIAESMKKQMLPTYIEVNDKYEVIDGQHRLEALKKLGIQVYYIINAGAGLPEAQRHNVIKKTWGHMDVLYSYMEGNNSSYHFLSYLMNKYNLSLQNVLVACDKGNHGQHTIHEFKTGTFVVSNKKEVEDLIVKTLKIHDVVKINRTLMWIACVKCVASSEFNLTVFLQKLAYLKNQFTPQVSVKQQIAQIEEIYNYKNRNKINLRIK